LWLVYVSTGILLAAYFMVFFVMKQNTYASRVIEIQNDQKVIDNGLYAVVRHTMYLFAYIHYCSIPLVLGSFYGLIPAILIPF
jgi:protein-S-isoprenylcysteine O-methyltransferase Ste14